MPPKCLKAPSNSINYVVQVEEHGVNIEDQVNEPMGEDDGTNKLIQGFVHSTR